MKQTQYLSNFQKQQYTQYLECQLQKFSTFMLSQKKQNQKYKHLEDVICDQNNVIVQLRQKMELLQVYAHENHQNSQIILKSNKKSQEYQDRLRRLQDRLRFGCDNQRIERHSDGFKQSNQKDSASQLIKLQKNIQEINKKVKYLQEDMSLIRNRSNQYGQKSQRNNEQMQNFIDKKALKKFQKKINKSFALKFQEIENIIRKSYRKKSKSPSFITPIDGSYSQSSINNTQKILSQFKINDQVKSNLKSDFSTVSRDTKLSKRQQSSLLELCNKKGKKSSKSRSKSKNRVSDDENRSRSKSIKKNKHKKQKSCSQDSYIKSSLSKSKINKSSMQNVSLSKSKSKSKKKIKNNKAKQINQKQNIRQGKRSCSHEKCKVPSFFIQQSNKLQNKLKTKQRK